ncbi:FAD-dependent oxidoreductase [Brachybacterium squillarum]|uniref:FAD-dependent oxidoreductase n=1 Tax=Brachybacterium squillarum TaxID=661979 RepID=UPI002223CA83|nr:FAD/NAD(P)-binding oxidoreductase [Brachybacterium squillarum]MCW1804158.1 NAD(P)/FAD-dependent oxidoreductase [Brachybacterium squillarum]
MPGSTRILVIGAGTAGSAAIRELAQHEEITATAIINAEVSPYNRTLINKAVITGLVDVHQAHLPDPSAPSIRDGVRAVNPLEQTVHLRSGARLDYDALIVATGSAPRPLPPSIASPAALNSGRVTHLHSLDDALRVRAILERTHSPQVLIYGAGFIGAETAGILRDAGCRITLAASSPIPGITAFGVQIAEQFAQAHQGSVDTRFGHPLTVLDLLGSGLHAVFADGHDVSADLAITALGTRPDAPAPWNGPILVDSRLRSGDHENVYAAGGVAVHELDGRTWRIDHWGDAAAQGTHAARSLLSAVGLGDDPGPYHPRTLYSAQIHQHHYFAAGHTSPLGIPRTASTDPLVLTHEHAGVLVGVSGLDAAPDVMGLVPHLHTPTPKTLTAEFHPSTYTP